MRLIRPLMVLTLGAALAGCVYVPARPVYTYPAYPYDATDSTDPASRTLAGGLIGAGAGAAIGGLSGGGRGAAMGALAGGVLGAAVGAGNAEEPAYPPPAYGGAYPAW